MLVQQCPAYLVDLVHVAVACDTLVEAPELKSCQQQPLMGAHVGDGHLDRQQQVQGTVPQGAGQADGLAVGGCALQVTYEGDKHAGQAVSSSSSRTELLLLAPGNAAASVRTCRTVRNTTMECTPQLSTRRLKTAGTLNGYSEYTIAMPGLRIRGALLLTLQQYTVVASRLYNWVWH